MMIATLTFQALAEWLLLAVGLASLHALILGSLALAICHWTKSASGRGRVLAVSVVLMLLALPWAGIRTWSFDEGGSHEPFVFEGSPAPEVDVADSKVAAPSAGSTSIVVAAEDPLPWQAILAGAYLVGLGFMASRQVTGIVAAQRLRARASSPPEGLLQRLEDLARRLGLPRVPRLGLSEHVKLPVLVGVFRPMILLPAALASGLSPAQLEAVLLHELAHLKRFDAWILAMQRVLETVLFFHPVVWWVSRRLSDERELGCDDLVLQSGTTALDYASAMTEVASASLPTRRGALGLAFAERRPSKLRRRIERVLNWQPAARKASALSALLLVSALLIGFTLPIVVWSESAASKELASKSPVPLESDEWNILVRVADEPLIVDRIPKLPEEQSWFPKTESQLLELRRIELEPALYDDPDFEVLVEFFYQGEEDEKRRILVDFTAKDAHQETLFNSWELTQDQRIGPELLDWGSRKVMRMPQNYSRFEIPAALQDRISSFEVRFREMQPRDYYHFPERPLKLDLRMTRPDSEGRFRLSFKAPEWWELPAEETGTAVVVLVPEGEGGEVKRQSAHVLKHPEADGRYALSLQMKPDLVDRAQVSITFLEEIEPGFTRDHVAGDGQRTGYGGPWSAQTFSLLHVPFED
ncbi:MAG: M56 family metallopeptidase [Planctomycetota bacterium]